MSRRSKTAGPCIYCGSTEPRVGREHVIPQAFGTFERNWTLTSVCDVCNRYFSRELELALARDSFESLLRLQLGLRGASEAKNLRHERVKMRVQQAGFFEGAFVRLEASEGEKALEQLAPILSHQVGLRTVDARRKLTISAR